MAAMRKEIDELKEVNDDAEQYSRRTCLVISGVPERMNENTDSRIIQLCKEDLGVDIKMDDVERSHRLGQQKPQSDGSTKPRIGTTNYSHTPRNIIVKFNSYRTREQVYSARFKLKNLSDENNHHVYINESLTKKRKELLWKMVVLEKLFMNFFNLQETGDYLMCFDNSFSRISEKIVYFDLALDYEDDGESDVPKWMDAVANRNEEVEITMEEIQTSLDIVSDNMRKSQTHQRQWRNIEFRDRYLSERNFERVNFWSLVNTIVMLVTLLIQVIMIRSLFGNTTKVRT
eukprot:XP_789340.3 PREDICTED: uncharacterized protein LOC584387 [Strongylocentrotus purpuratus]